ncbi:hypothetical protein [Microvirga alba]|uniref:Uncharacterized protein n=1 Tax=Microvirga alba TaxID=2791025 RepID=A0A931BQC3_9HYPH|nr:hypothetical protein [Microvirga alba]MBF9235001.1 hypothetical protein [Microvirga alba]
MKPIALAILAALTVAAPASAQYYPNPYSPPPEPEWGGPRPGYRHGPPPPPPGYGPPPHESRRPAQRQRVGNVCYTSRGSCEYPQYFPLNTPCRCDIPGFGQKRGAILY